jgi:hypothetical protein
MNITEPGTAGCNTSNSMAMFGTDKYYIGIGASYGDMLTCNGTCGDYCLTYNDRVYPRNGECIPIRAFGGLVYATLSWAGIENPWWYGSTKQFQMRVYWYGNDTNCTTGTRSLSFLTNIR